MSTIATSAAPRLLVESFKGLLSSSVRKSFADMPVDKYLPTPFRQRRFGRFIAKSKIGHRRRQWEMMRAEATKFRQSAGENKMFGNVPRQFEPLEEQVAADDTVQELLEHFATVTQQKPDTALGFHQMRIIAAHDMPGDPAPEGIHRDGFDYIGIYVVNRENISGAETSLYPAKNSDVPVLKATLMPEEFLVVDDRQYRHWTSSIRPLPGVARGVRDVIVITGRRDSEVADDQ
jgi:hypothetical protein